MSPIPGVAGVDYPEFNTVPDTGFDCGAQDTPGIYTDTEARCQVTFLYHAIAFVCSMLNMIN